MVQLRQTGLIRAVTGEARPRAIAVYQTYLLSSGQQTIRDIPIKEALRC
jgi:hypothetical protein